MVATIDSKYVRLRFGEKFAFRPFNISEICPKDINLRSEGQLDQLLNNFRILLIEIIPTGDKREVIFDSAKRNTWVN